MIYVILSSLYNGKGSLRNGCLMQELCVPFCAYPTGESSDQGKTWKNQSVTKASGLRCGEEIIHFECESATETKFLYPLLFAQSIVSNVLKIMVNFIFVKS